MDVALDSNVFIKDPWLNSQRTRALRDYLAKTPYRMVLSEVVEAEVRARRRREFDEKAGSAADSLAKARKAGVIGLLDFDPRDAVDITMNAWEARWGEFLDAASARRVGIRAEEAVEAARRAAFREAPCSPKGEGVRDALIWLALVADAADSEGGSGEHGLAFISENTKDFAAPARRTLREELMGDVRGRGSRLAYYASLEDFLRERAEPVDHVTREWVLSRLGPSQLEALVREYLRSGGAHNAWRVKDAARRDIYEIAGEPDLKTVNLKLEDFYVWQFDDGHAELRMTLGAEVEAMIDGLNVPEPWISYDGTPYYDQEEDLEHPAVLELECLALLAVRASARLEEDGLTEPVLEDIHRA
ncbi:MAG: DUF4935 domain-containing protein [Rubrobacter sp.]|nr:DUF4935 domain-containing protein [Rubrobacter sp.]